MGMTLRSWDWAGVCGRDCRIGGGGRWSPSVDSLALGLHTEHRSGACHAGFDGKEPGVSTALAGQEKELALPRGGPRGERGRMEPFGHGGKLEH